jgi:DNA mismatch repair protein MutS2
MVRIDKKTLEDLEFPQVLTQVAEFCITEPGNTRVLEITPFTIREQVVPELQRVKEFTASFGSDSPIPNHGFEPIFKELRLFEIENSTLEAFSFRKILTLSDATQSLLKFFKKFEEFYVALQSFASEVEFTPVLSEEIRKIFDKYGEVKDSASED